MKPYNEEILLAKWLAGELNDAEKAAVEQLPNFHELKAAISVMKQMDVPQPNLTNIKQILDKNRDSRPIRRLIPKIWISIAAAIFIGVLTWLFVVEKPVDIATNIAQHQSHTLPDHSSVMLNAQSSIHYYKSKWKKERTLNLNGQAFFNVEKGSTFTVESSQGKVQVVGTQFDVLSRKHIFEVVCYEGKVRVTTAQIDTLLTAGKGLSVNEEGAHYFNTDTNASPWISRVLDFRLRRLSFVFEELERQFGVEIDYSKINSREKFSGTIPLDDQKLALEIVCRTMTLKYEFSSDKKKVVITQ